MIGIAIPAQEDPGRPNGWRKELEKRRGSRWISPGQPFLPIVHSIAVRVRVICRAVCREPVLLEPSIRDEAVIQSAVRCAAAKGSRVAGQRAVVECGETRAAATKS